MHLSRRLFIAGGSAAAAATSLPTPQSASAAAAATQVGPARAAPASISLEPVALKLLGTTSTVFDAAFATALPFEEVNAVQVAGAAAALSGAIVEVEFDSRVSAVSADDVVVSWGGHLSRCGVTATMAGRASLVLPHFGEDAQVEAVVGLPLGTRPLYPHENVGTPTATSVTIRAANGSNLAAAAATTTTNAVAGPVWGAELGGGYR